MDKEHGIIIALIVVTILLVATILIIGGQRNDFCQKIGYEETAFIGNQLYCRKTVDNIMETIPIYCEAGRCWKIIEVT